MILLIREKKLKREEGIEINLLLLAPDNISFFIFRKKSRKTRMNF